VQNDDGDDEHVDAGAFESEIGDALRAAVVEATEKWFKRRKAEERAGSTANRALHLKRSKRIGLKEACYEVMEQAYHHVRDDGHGGVLPANARQILYQVRRLIQPITDATLTNDYFSQTILPGYQRDYRLRWDVVYDDRGHFTEPHTNVHFGVGTSNVRNYIGGLGEPEVIEAGFAPAKVETHGPSGRYGGVLYIEKEGFDELFERAETAKRHDLAFMSNKGMSVTAARELAEANCRKLGGVPLFALHDCDKAGFSIRSTLGRDTDRYQFTHEVKLIDLGLRLADVHDLGVEDLSEKHTDRGEEEVRAANLRLNGATEEEVSFLLKRRVELNALTSRQLIEFVERKLIQHGVRKIVPAGELLAETYRAHVRSERVRSAVEAIIADGRSGDIAVPDKIREQVEDLLKHKPTMSWDEAVAEIVKEVVA
jgi:hypothetical protein